MSQSCTKSFRCLYRRRKLTMISCQYYPVGFPYRNPAGSFKCLSGLINKQCSEFLPCQQAIGTANQCAGNYTSLRKQRFINANFQFCCTVFQRINLLPDSFSFSAFSAPGIQFAYRFTNTP